MRYFSILLLACLASTLVADDIGVALGDKAWLLLSEPLGPGRDEKKPDLSPYAGDPGFPAPNWGGASGYAPTELWRFDAATGTYTRVTQLVTNKDNLALPGSRRTLYAPFLIGGEPYVIHFDGAKLHDGASMCQVIKASAAKLNEGKKPLLDGVVLASVVYIDSPVVSPDGARVAFRAFGASGCTLRVFNASDWKPVGETEARNWGRPVWCANRSLCAIAYDRPTLEMRVNAEDPKPEPGKLTRIEFADAVSLVTLLEGSFPPDTYSRCVAFDAARNRLVVARQVPRMKDGAEVGKEIVVEERDAAPPPKEIARFDHFRGIVIDKSSVYVAGVRDRAADDDKKLDRRLILMQLRKISPAPETGEKDEVVGSAHREMSPDGRGGLQDLGDGVGVMLEPAFNPLAGAPGQAHFLHTLNVLNWRECDSLRNPRVIQYLSAMARRFKEIDEFTLEYGEGANKRLVRPRITSTLLGFDLDIKLNNNAIKNKKGRYLELFEGSGRKGAGRIRVEDNIGGNWTVNAVSGDGTEAGDTVFDNSAVNAAGGLNKTAASRSGTYNKLLSQIDSRKLLMLVGLELSAEKGGVTFSGRDTWRDPITGQVKRIWIFKRKGAGKNASTMGFIADAPTKPAEFPNAHPLLVAAVAFAMSNNQVQSSILAFDSSYVELPDLSPYKDKGSPPMLLPKVVRAYERNAAGELEEQFSATLLTEFQHEKNHIKDGYVRCGYNVWSAKSDENFTELMMRVRVK